MTRKDAAQGKTRPSANPVSGLAGFVRHRRQRLRNLRELKSLDAARLQDIGLTPYRRAELVCG